MFGRRASLRAVLSFGHSDDQSGKEEPKAAPEPQGVDAQPGRIQYMYLESGFGIVVRRISTLAVAQLKNLNVPCPYFMVMDDDMHLASNKFGVSLTTVFLTDPAPGLLKPPNTVHAICKALRPHLNVQGIFRMGGNLQRVQQAVEELEDLKTLKFHEMLPHDLTSLLKYYMRHLPQAVIPNKAYDAYDIALSLTPNDIKWVAVNNITLALPAPHQHLLIYLIRYLKEVSTHSSSNQMTLDNLLICFVTQLFEQDEAPKPNANLDPLKAKEMMDKLRGKMARQQEIVQYMVESVELLGSVNPDMRQKVMQMPRANDEKLEYYMNGYSKANVAKRQAEEKTMKRARGNSAAAQLQTSIKGIAAGLQTPTKSDSERQRSLIKDRLMATKKAAAAPVKEPAAMPMLADYLVPKPDIQAHSSESRSGGATSGTSSIQEAAIVGMPNSPDAIHKAVYYDSSYSPNVVRANPDGATAMGDIWKNVENGGDADEDGRDFDTRSISSTTSRGLSRMNSWKQSAGTSLSKVRNVLSPGSRRKANAAQTAM